MIDYMKTKAGQQIRVVGDQIALGEPTLIAASPYYLTFTDLINMVELLAPEVVAWPEETTDDNTQ